MQISDEALDEFIKIYKEESGKELTKAEAVEMANRLLTLFEALSKPLPDELKSTATQPQRENDLPSEDTRVSP